MLAIVMGCIGFIQLLNTSWEGAATLGGEHFPAPILFCDSPLDYHYEADAAFVVCIDQRFKKAVTDFEHHTWPDTERDPLTSLGGVMPFATDDVHSIPTELYAALEDRVNPKLVPYLTTAHRLCAWTLLYEIDKSIALHRTKRIVLSMHEECGAYGARMPKRKQAPGTFEVFVTSELRKGARFVRAHLEQIGKRNFPIELVAFYKEGPKRARDLVSTSAKGK